MSSMSLDTGNKFLNPIWMWGQTLDINPINGQIDRPCPNDHKNL